MSTPTPSGYKTIITIQFIKLSTWCPFYFLEFDPYLNVGCFWIFTFYHLARKAAFFRRLHVRRATCHRCIALWYAATFKNVHPLLLREECIRCSFSQDPPLGQDPQFENLWLRLIRQLNFPAVSPQLAHLWYKKKKERKKKG